MPENSEEQDTEQFVMTFYLFSTGNVTSLILKYAM